MNSGDLDQFVTLQRRVETRNEIGEAVLNYQDLSLAWAAVEPLTGREYFQAQQTQSEVTTRIRINWRRGIVPLMRVIHTVSYDDPVQRDVYDVLTVLDQKAAHNELHLMCARRQSDNLGNLPGPITADMDSITADNDR